MRILELFPYYSPEQISSSHLDRDLEESFVNAGFDLEIYTPTPTRGISLETYQKYKKIRKEIKKDGHIQIHRFRMVREGRNTVVRAIRYLLVNIKQYYYGINADGIDLIYSASTPPTQGILCARVAKKLGRKYGHTVPFIYNLQDVFPDSLVNAKMTTKGSLIWKIGRKIEDYTYRNADKIIVISNDIRDNILAKGADPSKITVIPNWIDTEAVFPVPRKDNRLFDEYNISRDKFIVVYAGTMGAMQGTDIIIEAAEQVKDENIHFIVFGGGIAYENAKKYVQEHKLANITITAMLPPDRVSEVYSMGDIALITCKSGVGRAGMPSKTWSIMACNTPIIASFDQESELSRLLSMSKAGICVPPESRDDLVEAIMRVKKSGFHSEGRNYVISHAGKKERTNGYVETIKSTLRNESKV